MMHQEKQEALDLMLPNSFRTEESDGCNIYYCSGLIFNPTTVIGAMAQAVKGSFEGFPQMLALHASARFIENLMKNARCATRLRAFKLGPRQPVFLLTLQCGDAQLLGVINMTGNGVTDYLQACLQVSMTPVVLRCREDGEEFLVPLTASVEELETLCELARVAESDNSEGFMLKLAALAKWVALFDRVSIEEEEVQEMVISCVV